MPVCGPIGEHLQDHLRRAYGMLRETIKSIPDDVWRVQPEHGPLPAFVAYHTIEIQDCWTSGQREETFAWGRLGPCYEKSPEQMPSQADLLAYLDEVEAQTLAFVARPDAELVAPIDGYDWAGGTTLALMLHGLRHVMHHQGQLAVVQWAHAPEIEGTWL